MRANGMIVFLLPNFVPGVFPCFGQNGRIAVYIIGYPQGIIGKTAVGQVFIGKRAIGVYDRNAFSCFLQALQASQNFSLQFCRVNLFVYR